MKHSIRMILPVLAAALLLTGCGGHRRDVSDESSGVTSRNDVVSRAEERATDDARNGREMASDAVQNGKELASDAVQGGKELASDAVQGGKELASDAVQNGKELVSDAAEDVNDAMNKGDGDGDYRTNDNGRVLSDD